MRRYFFSRTDFLPWEFLLSKKLEIEKTKTTFIISVLKVVSQVTQFFQILTFLLTKVPREGNLFVKKVPIALNLQWRVSWIMVLFFDTPGPNVSTTPSMAVGCLAMFTSQIVQLKGKHCQKLHCRNGVVDTFRPGVPGGAPKQWRYFNICF